MIDITEWVRDYQQWAGHGLIAILFITCLFVWYRDVYPQRKERALSRKQERELVGQILSDALQDSCHSGRITAEQWHKYNKLVAAKLGLTNMVSKKPVDVNRLKALSIQRLTRMGVDITESLRRMHRRRNAKKKILTVKKLPLP